VVLFAVSFRITFKTKNIKKKEAADKYFLTQDMGY